MFTCMCFGWDVARIKGMRRVIDEQPKATLIPAEPLTEEGLAEIHATALATTVLRLEGIYRDLIGDVQHQRDYGEKGADPRLIKLQLETLKEMARLLRLEKPAPVVGGEVEEVDVEAEAQRAAADLELKRRLVLEGLDRMGLG